MIAASMLAVAGALLSSFVWAAMFSVLDKRRLFTLLGRNEILVRWMRAHDYVAYISGIVTAATLVVVVVLVVLALTTLPGIITWMIVGVAFAAVSSVILWGRL